MLLMTLTGSWRLLEGSVRSFPICLIDGVIEDPECSWLKVFKFESLKYYLKPIFQLLEPKKYFRCVKISYVTYNLDEVVEDTGGN